MHERYEIRGYKRQDGFLVEYCNIGLISDERKKALWEFAELELSSDFVELVDKKRREVIAWKYNTNGKLCSI